MGSRLVHIGFGNMVCSDRVVAIINPSSAPLRRLREEARNAGLLVDATQGRKTRSVLIMDSKHVVISAIQPETIASRFESSPEDKSTGSVEEVPK
ncbi:MAG: DUF370 domain-containing protein [Synergistaceae bacterium]|nr:DUF370 domain-containing protein [Synergistaceae bacterium]